MHATPSPDVQASVPRETRYQATTTDASVQIAQRTRAPSTGAGPGPLPGRSPRRHYRGGPPRRRGAARAAATSDEFPRGRHRDFHAKLPRMTWETIRNLVRDEWVILSLLLAWSLAGLTVICERFYALWNILPRSETFKNRVVDALEHADLGKAAALCEMYPVPLAEAFERGLQVYQKRPNKTPHPLTPQPPPPALSPKPHLSAPR